MKLMKMLNLVEFSINDATTPVVAYVKNLDGESFGRTPVLNSDEILLSDELIMSDDNIEKEEVVKVEIDTTLAADENDNEVTLIIITFVIDYDD